MKSSFVAHDVYASIFEPDKAEQLRIDDFASNFWDNICLESWKSSEVDAPAFEIISVGYGSGRLDLPLIASLAEQLASAGCTRAINVTAIEPLWNNSYGKSGRECLKAHGFLPNPDDSTITFARDRVILNVFSGTIEQWETTSQACPKGIDLLLALFVVHLLDDWKASLGQLLRQFRPRGLALFGENFGDVCCLDGELTEAGPPSATPWQRAWRKIFDVRDSLLIPRLRIVSPRSLNYLAEALVSAGLPETVDKNNTIGFRKYLTWHDLYQLLKTAVGGPDAATFQALRILDSKRATQFAQTAQEALREIESSFPGPLTFDVGIRVRGFRQLDQHSDFLKAAGRTALKHAPFLAATTRALFKKSIADAEAQSPPFRPAFTSNERRKAALGSALASLREALALSHGSLMVFNTRRHERYLTALTLLPNSVIGRSTADNARIFASRYALYVSGASDFHLSALLGLLRTDTTPWGDLAIEISMTNAREPSLEFFNTYDGLPFHLLIRLPASLAIKVLQLADAYIAHAGIQRKIGDFAFRDWNNETGFSNFYTSLDVEPSQLAQAITDSISKRNQLEDAIVSLSQPIRKLLHDKFCHFGFFEMSRSSCTILEEIVGRILRLAVINWLPSSDSLCWTSCFFAAMQSAYPRRVPVGAGLLMLLTESDRRSLLGDQRVDIGVSCVPFLMGAIQPFLSFLQDIEMADYAVSAGSWASGQVMSHELKNVCWSITNNWVRPPCNWFDVEECDEAELPDGKLGIIRTPWLSHVNEMGIASYRQLVQTTGYQIRLWSGLNRCTVLPFAGSAAPKTLATFATAAFDFALDVMLVHALYNRPPFPGRPGDFGEIRAVSNKFKEVFSEAFQTLGDESAKSLSVRWIYPDNMEELGDQTLYLGKLFISLFCNVIQHADPFRPICLDLRLQERRLLVQIQDVPRKEEVSESDLAEKVQAQAQAIPALAGMLANALNQSKQSVKAMRLTSLSSETVMRDALEGLNGSMRLLHDTQDLYELQLEVDAMSWS